MDEVACGSWHGCHGCVPLMVKDGGYSNCAPQEEGRIMYGRPASREWEVSGRPEQKIMVRSRTEQCDCELSGRLNLQDAQLQQLTQLDEAFGNEPWNLQYGAHLSEMAEEAR